SFTLTPMLCSRFLKLEPGQAGHAKSKAGLIWRILDRSYGGILWVSLRAKFLIVLLTLGVVASTVPIAQVMGVTLIPRDDQSEYEVSVTTPEGYSLERSLRVFAELEGRLRTLPGTIHLFSTIGQVAGGQVAKGQGDVTQGTIYVRMTELEDRFIGIADYLKYLVTRDRKHIERPAYTQFAIQDEARKFLVDYPDLRASVNDISPFQGGRRPQTFQVNLAGPDLEKLTAYAEELKERLSHERGLTDLDTTLSLRKPEIQVAIDRERASDLGIPVGTIADTLRILVGGLPVSNFKSGGEQYDVWLRAAAVDRASARDLYQLTLPSPRAGLVKLTSVARLIENRGPSEIERLGRQRIVTVLANPDPQILPLGGAIDRATAILAEMKLPPDYSYEFSGQAKTMGETGKYFLIAFGLSILFMYLILAAQFESWMQPVAILMALPVTVPFGLLSLVLFRTPMDLYAMFGLFMLVGIVKKNGILQVDSTNQLRARGLNRHDAIMEANHTRLRPILMTTVMLVAAMVPIALGQGPGSGARASMAKVIIGGQMLSLILALLVTPVFYALLDTLAGFSRRIGIRFSVEPSAPRPAPSSPPVQAPAPAAVPTAAPAEPEPAEVHA
ncbi:MAG TPA: efflux RND transporter permease subunit, partial [Isosphaeraceae bacterium]